MVLSRVQIGVQYARKQKNYPIHILGKAELIRMLIGYLINVGLLFQSEMCHSGRLVPLNTAASRSLISKL